MDPNAARSKMIELANRIIAEGAVITDGAVELAEAVHDLDEWLRSGGFLPSAWLVRDAAGEQPGRRQDVDVQAAVFASHQELIEHVTTHHSVPGEAPLIATSHFQGLIEWHGREHVTYPGLRHSHEPTPRGLIDLEGSGTEQDDERPRVDGGVCGHDVWSEPHMSLVPCILDRGHEGDHVPA